MGGDRIPPGEWLIWGNRPPPSPATWLYVKNLFDNLLDDSVAIRVYCVSCPSAPAVCNSLPKTVVNSHSVAVVKSRLKIFLFSQAFSLPHKNSCCNGNLLCDHSVAERNRIYSLGSHGKASEKEYCLPGVFCDSGDTPANLLCELNGHLMPCTSCFYGKRVEDVCAGQFGVFVYLDLCCLVGCCTWFSCCAANVGLSICVWSCLRWQESEQHVRRTASFLTGLAQS